MRINFFKELSNKNTPVEVPAGQTVAEVLQGINLDNTIILANGKPVESSYILKEGDLVTVRMTPGWTGVAIALAIVAGVAAVAAGVASYRAKVAAEKAKKELEKLKNSANNSEIDNRPFLRGASNEYAQGKTLPYICGKSFFTPYLLCRPFYELTGADGINQFVNNILVCGFNKQVFHQVAIDDVIIKKFSGATSPQEGAYNLDTGIFAEGGSLEIAQDGNPLSSLTALNSKVESKVCKEEIPKDEVVAGGTKPYLTYTLDPNAKNVDIAITFPYGLYEIDDSNKKKAHTVTITPQYSLNGGSTWIDFTFSGVLQTTTTRYEGKYKFGSKMYRSAKWVKQHPEAWIFVSGTDVRNSGQSLDIDVKYVGDYDDDRGASYTITASYTQTTSARINSNTFTRNEPNKELRYVAHKDFSLSDYTTLHNNGQTAIYIRLRSNGTTDNKAHNECYCLYYQSVCFDPNKSSLPAGILDDGGAAGLVSCKVLEPREQAFCTLLGIRAKATLNNENKFEKINIISTGTARTWNGSTLSSTKTATRNPGAWALEIETSDRHPASRRADSELDLESYKDFYNYCSQNNFYFDYALTTELKKDDLLQYIMEATGACIYTDIHGRRAIAIDRAQENALAIYNPQNIISVQNKKTFGRRTDGLRIKYINSVDDIWKEDTYIVMREVSGVPLPLTPDSIIKDIDAAGITTHAHVVKYARRLMAIEALRPKTTTIEVGNEGVFYTPFSKVLLQDDSLKIGTGHAVINELGYINGELKRIYLNGKVTFEQNKSYGVIINCINEDGMHPLALKVEGEGYTDRLTVITSSGEEDDVRPGIGNVLSFGELDDSGNFTRIATPYLISNIRRNEKGFSLDLVNYDEAIYDSGTIPEYKSNITQKPATPNAEIPPDYVSHSELEDALNQINTEGMDNPDVPMSLKGVATQQGIELSCAVNMEGLRNDLQDVVFTVKRPGNMPAESIVANGTKGMFYFDREIDGYPEKEDLDDYRITAIAINIYGKESEETADTTVDTDSYGTWLVQPPVITERTNKRSLHIHLEQPTGQREIYGNVRYQIQISRYDDIDGATRLWYKPNLSSAADPYGAETNYKVDTDPAPDPAYVVATDDFSQTVPLQGQSATPAAPSDTVYYYRVLAFNEAGCAMHEVEGVSVPYYAETNQMTARATGARDVVLAHMNDGTQHPDALTAKNIYAENLTAIVGTFSQMQGDVETSDNFWKGMDTNNPEFRVGNDHNLEEQNDEDAEFIHYKDGSLAMKLKNFIVTVAETTIKGTLTLYNAAKTFRNLVSSAGMRFQKKVTDWLNPVDVAQISADSDSNLTITNNPAAVADYQIAPPSNSIKIHHLDTSLNDTDGNNTENLVAARGGCGATAEPILERLTSYFAGKLKKAGVVTKSAPAYNQQAWTQSGFVILGVCNGIVAGYTVSGDVYTCKTYNAATGDLLTSFDITFGSNVTNRKVKAFWVKTPAFGYEFVFGSSYYAVIPQVYSKYFWYFCHQDGTGIWGAPDAGADLGCAYNYSKDSFVAFATGISGKTLTVQTVDLSGWGRATYSYTINNQYVTELIAGQVAGGMIMLKFNNTNLPSHPWLYIVPWNCTGDINTNIYEELYFVDSWTDYGSDNGYFHLLNESGTRYLFPNTSLMNPVTINSDYFPIRNGADNDTVYLYKPGDNSIYALANGTYSKIGTTVASSSYLARFDNNKKYYAVGNSLYYYPSYCQVLVAEKHYAFWFKGSSIKFGKLSIPTDPARWLYCRLTASGSTVSYYIVRDTLVNGALDVFANSSKSLATYSWEEDNNDLDFTLEGSVEEFTSDAADISSAVMLSMVQYKLPYGAPGSSGNLPGSDKFILLAKDPNKVTSNVIGAAQVLNANDAVTLSAGANPGARLVFITTGACTITYTGILGAQVTDSLGANVQVEYTWNGNAWLCTSAPPIGRIIEQKPDEPTPAAMYGGQWQEHNYGGVFFRSKGGDSCGFHAAYKVASWASGSSVTLAENAVDGNGTAISANNYILVAVYANGASYYRKITAVSSRTLTLGDALPSGYANLTEVIIGQQEKLPNILSGNFRFYNYGHHNIAVVSGGGAIQATNEATNPSGWGGGENSRQTTNALYLDASKTTGSGSGVYQSNKHVQANNITVVYWERLQ